MDCPKYCPNIAFRENRGLAVPAPADSERFYFHACNPDVLFRDFVNILVYLSVAYSTAKYIYFRRVYISEECSLLGCGAV
jgi:hypothetical protein